MFLSVYKTTLKNLFRSLLFWLMLVLLLGFSLYQITQASHATYSFEHKEKIWDTDPRYVLLLENYVQKVDNDCINTMLYVMPLFCVVAVFLTLSCDYGDGFYEVERAGGQKPLCYLTGRLAALATVCLPIFLLAILCREYLYVITRGGVEGMENGELALDVLIRTVRTVVCTTWPAILMFIAVTYAIGALFKNAWTAAAGTSIFIMLNYLFHYQLRFRMPDWYCDYLAPMPSKVRHYFKFYDYYTSAEFEAFLVENNTSFEQMLTCVAYLLGLTLIYSLVSYLRLRHREI